MYQPSCQVQWTRREPSFKGPQGALAWQAICSGVQLMAPPQRKHGEGGKGEHGDGPYFVTPVTLKREHGDLSDATNAHGPYLVMSVAPALKGEGKKGYLFSLLILFSTPICSFVLMHWHDLE